MTQKEQEEELRHTRERILVSLRILATDPADDFSENEDRWVAAFWNEVIEKPIAAALREQAE